MKKRWYKLVALSILLQLAAFVVVPVALLFATDKLPKWASWFGNDTDSIDGDPDHRDRRAKGWPVYLRRLTWLLRNRVHNWSRSVGCLQDKHCMVAFDGEEPSDYYGRTGLMTAWALRKGKVYWERYSIEKNWMGLYTRKRTGWKLVKLAPDDPRHPYTAALVCYYNPFVTMP